MVSVSQVSMDKDVLGFPYPFSSSAVLLQNGDKNNETESKQKRRRSDLNVVFYSINQRPFNRLYTNIIATDRLDY